MDTPTRTVASACLLLLVVFHSVSGHALDHHPKRGAYGDDGTGDQGPKAKALDMESLFAGFAKSMIGRQSSSQVQNNMALGFHSTADVIWFRDGTLTTHISVPKPSPACDFHTSLLSPTKMFRTPAIHPESDSSPFNIYVNRRVDLGTYLEFK